MGYRTAVGVDVVVTSHCRLLVEVVVLPQLAASLVLVRPRVSTVRRCSHSRPLLNPYDPCACTAGWGSVPPLLRSVDAGLPAWGLSRTLPAMRCALAHPWHC